MPSAVATDVGAWRVVRPVLCELLRRGRPIGLMVAEPAATIARQEGPDGMVLRGPTPEARADEVLAAGPSALLLGTSAKPVVEHVLARRARREIPTLGVLDSMLFVERRFGPDLGALPDLVACPDEETAARLRRIGVPAAALVVTGNPTLEEIGLIGASSPPPVAPDRPVDILFVSSPVSEMRLRGVAFAIDERESLADVLVTLSALRPLAPAGFRVRVRLHPVQQAEELPPDRPGIALAPDGDLDRLRSCARARVVVGLSSTLLGEARLLPRAAVAYLPGPFWDTERPFAPELGVRLARTPRDLHDALAEALTAPPAPAPLADHLGAAARIADLFEQLAGSGRPRGPA